MPKTWVRDLAVELAGERPQLKVLYMSGYTNDDALRRAVVEE
jgi:hypothetical protein